MSHMSSLIGHGNRRKNDGIMLCRRGTVIRGTLAVHFAVSRLGAVNSLALSCFSTLGLIALDNSIVLPIGSLKVCVDIPEHLRHKYKPPER